MGALTTHVLDTAAGKPGRGVRYELYGLRNERRLLAKGATGDDGRCSSPLLEGDDFVAGEYELVFQAGAYFSRTGSESASPPFLGEVVIRFGVADAGEHYHVPLLLSPYGYTTYRGS